MPTYTPKHKRVLRDGQTARGPARWFRAADSAMRKPMSGPGRLFWTRAERANVVARMGDTGPYVHRDWRGRVQYHTCSSFCAAMVVQLDEPDIQTQGELVSFLTYYEGAPEMGRPPRTVRCQFCASDIKR